MEKMNFKELAKFWQKLESTDSRLEMTAVLARLLSSAPPFEIGRVCYLTLGRLAPLYEPLEFNIAEKLMTKILAAAFTVGEGEVKEEFGRLGDLGKVAERYKGLEEGEKGRELAVGEVYERLVEVAEAEGAGSVERKIRLFSRLLRRLDPLSVRYLVRIPLGKMRLGLAEKTVLDALSFVAAGDKSLRKPLEQAYNVCSDIGEIAHEFRKGGIKGLKGIKVRAGKPVLAMLCQRVPTAQEIMEKMGSSAAVEPKLDGTRVQVHIDRGKRGERGFLAKAFTRNLEDVTAMFPDVLGAVSHQVRAKSVILDGEAVGCDADSGRFLPFQITMQRKRKYDIKEKVKEVPLKYFVFDILYRDGESLLEKPLGERRRILEEVLGKGSKRGEETVEVISQNIVESPARLGELLKEAVGRGLEGLVVKRPDSAYEAGGRGFSWVKFKYEGEGSLLADTIDAVVLGYYFGRGKRAKFGISAFLVGVYDAGSDVFKTVSKIGTGLSDEQWVEMRVQSSKFKVQSCPKGVEVPKELVPDVWVAPKMVVAVRADEITKSPLHAAGLALRFPRLMTFRDDKAAEQATTLKELKKMYQDQGRV